MKTKKINLVNLRNAEHFQFHTEFINLVKKIGAEPLKIQAQFESYLDLFSQEDEAFNKVVKSAITADIQDADKHRSSLFRGMVVSNKAALIYFDEKVQVSAKRLQILFDTYGNLSQKPLNEKTSGIHNLLQELNDAYAQDSKLVGLSTWAKELQKSNDTFNELMNERYEERAHKTDLVLREVRMKVDDVYRFIVERIDALNIVEGEHNYGDFIRNLNAVIEKYSATLAQRSKKKEVVGE